jgi:Zn-dependent peptidase ImmA (M78 family)
MALRRGFKAEAARIALEFRAEMGLAAGDRLDPHAACAHLAIPVATLSSLEWRDPEAATQLLRIDSSCFSAGTVLSGSMRLIVLNDSHHVNRQSSSLAHELSHVVLEHPPGPAIDPETGCRTWSDEHEQEADWLGGCLLVPRDGLAAIVTGAEHLVAAAEHFCVSDEMISYRYNVTGLRRQHERRARGGLG